MEQNERESMDELFEKSKAIIQVCLILIRVLMKSIRDWA